MKRQVRLEGGDSVRVAYPLFQTEGGGAKPTSPLQLDIHTLGPQQAVCLNELWHSRLPLFGGIPRICFGAEYQNIYYAVAIWSSPVARLLPQTEWLELRRLAIAPDSPRNTASRILAVMARKIKDHFPDVTTLISYQDTEVHTGAIYKASGWKIDHYAAGQEWSRPSRPSLPQQSASPKIRWRLDIKKNHRLQSETAGLI